MNHFFSFYCFIITTARDAFPHLSGMNNAANVCQNRKAAADKHFMMSSLNAFQWYIFLKRIFIGTHSWIH